MNKFLKLKVCFLSLFCSCSYYDKNIIIGKYSGAEEIKTETQLLFKERPIGKVTSSYNGVIKIQLWNDIDLRICDTFFLKNSILGSNYIYISKCSNPSSKILTFKDTVNIEFDKKLNKIDTAKQRIILKELNKTMKTIDSVLKTP